MELRHAPVGEGRGEGSEQPLDRAAACPLLLLGWIGHAVGSRIWRLLWLIVLCATLPWCIYLLGLLRKAPATIQWTPLDRT